MEMDSLFRAEEMGGISLEDVFDAYFECRKHKRNTYNALAFEMEYERNCIELWREINEARYKPKRSIAFIVTKPVRREVFAADFRDRVVHHIIASRLMPIFEERFIDDNYSTRRGKGTLYGILRMEEHIRECSENYTKECYILKIDIQSFFMSIDKRRLYEVTERVVRDGYHAPDVEMLLYLLRETIFNRPEMDCVCKSPATMWRSLPREKSLFGTDGSHGLPIGNLTSQLLALNYLDGLDHLVKEQCGICHYGRYVDDMVLVHSSRERLIEAKRRIESWLTAYGLRLHPRKVYLQHYSKGVLFVGAMLMPGRRYLSNRTVGFLYDAIRRKNRLAHVLPGYVGENAQSFTCMMNSYLGMMCHFSSYKIRRRAMRMVGDEWWMAVMFDGHISKSILKHAYDPLWIKAKEVIEAL
jgi:hypothetical protein